MPGVPSSRGCEACRKQKKKCDQAEPTCSRCLRLNLQCVGAGQQKYLFKQEAGHTRKPISQSNSSPPTQDQLGLSTIVSLPSNELSVLAASFLDSIKTTTSIKYNLVWSQGGYLEHIPQRLGRSAALDSAADAIASAHRGLCLRQEPSIATLTKYSKALKILRACLEDPLEIRKADTLCAVMLLLTCQSFIGVEKNWMGHYQGAAQILKARRYYDPQDEFESMLLLTLRGPVVFGAIFDSKISFSPSEWETIIVSKFDGPSPEGQMMRRLATFPDLIHRANRVAFQGNHDPGLVRELETSHQLFTEFLDGLRSQVAQYSNTPEHLPESNILVRMQARLQRLLSISLSIAVIFNITLRLVDARNSETLVADSEGFASEILTLEPLAERYRPLGGAHMSLSLAAAWLATSNQQRRVTIELLIAKYMTDIPHDKSVSVAHRNQSLLRMLRAR